MTERHLSRLFWIVRALLVAILVYVTVAAVVTPLHLGRALPRSVAGNERASDGHWAESNVRPVTDASAILEGSLFAGSAAPPGPSQGAVPDVGSADEELGLRLIGVIAGGPATSRAIIQSTAARTVGVYRVGDPVASATVESIQTDTVLLRHEGRRKALRLHAGGPLPGDSRQEMDAPRSSADAEKPASESPASQTPAQNPTKLGYVEDIFRKATIEPYTKNGRVQGLRISGLQNEPLAAMFGLRDGDIVQSVNGQTLTNKQKAFQVLQKARTQPGLHMQLLRNGKTKDLAFDLQAK